MTEASTTGVNVSNDQLFATLMEIKGDMGALKMGQSAIQSSLLLGTSATTALSARVTTLEMARAKQAGALAVIGAMFSALGAIIGVVVNHFWSKGH